MAEKKTEENEEKKDISVKGVSRDVYGMVLKVARDTGRTLGEITNDAYKAFLSTASGAKQISKSFMAGASQGLPKYVENIKNLSMDKKDLEDIGHKVVFRNIDSLDLKDVDDETFDKYVDSITNVKVLRISKPLSKAKVVLKCNFVNNIEIE